MLIQMLVAGIATISFSIIFSTPKKEYLYCGITGAIGWGCYLLSNSVLSSVTMATFVGTLAVTIVSRFFAVNRRLPVTIFLISGIFPLVPGMGIYFTTYYLVMNEMALAGEYGRESIGIVLGIAFGIMLVFLIPQKWINYRRKNKKFENMIKKWY